MSSENQGKNENVLRIMLGENTNKLVLPDKREFVLHRLTYRDLAQLENRTDSSILEWRDKNPFNRLTNMLFAIHCSLKRDPKFNLSEDEVGDLFGLGDADALFKVVQVIMELSGIKVADKEVKEGNEQGSVKGTETNPQA